MRPIGGFYMDFKAAGTRYARKMGHDRSGGKPVEAYTWMEKTNKRPEQTLQPLPICDIYVFCSTV